jgi:hypothetical protein
VFAGVAAVVLSGVAGSVVLAGYVLLEASVAVAS